MLYMSRSYCSRGASHTETHARLDLSRPSTLEENCNVFVFQKLMLGSSSLPRASMCIFSGQTHDNSNKRHQSSNYKACCQPVGRVPLDARKESVSWRNSSSMRSKTEFKVTCQTMRFILSATTWRARMARGKSDKPLSSLKHSVSTDHLATQCAIRHVGLHEAHGRSTEKRELARANIICGALHLRLRKHQASLLRFGKLVRDGVVVHRLA